LIRERDETTGNGQGKSEEKADETTREVTRYVNETVHGGEKERGRWPKGRQAAVRFLKRESRTASADASLLKSVDQDTKVWSVAVTD